MTAPWIVDTCVIIDILDGDPLFGNKSAAIVDRYSGQGLAICPVTYIELSPAFLGSKKEQEFFLRSINIDFDSKWTKHDSEYAFQAWNRYVTMKRIKRIQKRPIADIQIGAYATSRQGIITRNPKDFSPFFPQLKIVTP